MAKMSLCNRPKEQSLFLPPSEEKQQKLLGATKKKLKESVGSLTLGFAGSRSALLVSESDLAKDNLL